MRVSLRESGSKITGRDRKPRCGSGSFTMTAKFLSVSVLRITGRRRPGDQLRPSQEVYRLILGLRWEVFTNPAGRPRPWQSRYGKR